MVWRVQSCLVSSALASAVPAFGAMHELQFWEDKYTIDAGEWDQYEIDFTHLYPLLADKFEGRDIKRALIPGCGTSKIPQQMTDWIEGVRTIGVDFSNVVVEAMRTRIPSEMSRKNQISYVHMDVLEMGQSFGSEVMDIILDKSMLDTLRLRPDSGNMISSYLETLHFLLAEHGLAIFVTPTRPQDLIPVLHKHPNNGFNCGDIRGLPRPRPLNEKFEILDSSWTNITVYACERVKPGETNKDVVFTHNFANEAFSKKAERDARKLKADIRAEEEARMYREKLEKMQKEIKAMEDARATREAEAKAAEEAELQRMLDETAAIKQRAAEQQDAQRRQIEQMEALEAQKQLESKEQALQDAADAEAQAMALEKQAEQEKATKKKKKKGDVNCLGFWGGWTDCHQESCTQERVFEIMSVAKGEGQPCEAKNNEKEVRVCETPCETGTYVRPADEDLTPADELLAELEGAAEAIEPEAVEAALAEESAAATEVVQEPAAPEAPPAPPQHEYRIDPADGNPYPIWEFQAFYPDWEVRWANAQVYTPPGSQPPVVEEAVSAVPEESAPIEEPVVEQKEPVKDMHCMGVWSDWSKCQVDCNMRRSLAHKIKQSGNGDHCDHDDGFTQTMECFHGGCKPNCHGEWSEWSACAPAMTEGACGMKSRSYSIIRKKKRPQDQDCKIENGTVEMQDCDCPEPEPEEVDLPNCEAFWTERTACGESCTQELEYTVLSPPGEGGAPCEHEDGHVITQDCRGGGCGKAEL